MRERLQEHGWLLLLWILVVGFGIIGSFLEWRRFLPQEPVPVPIVEEIPQPQFILSATASAQPVVSAKRFWLYERSTGSLLAEHNAQEATSVASLAKLMTAYTVFETMDIDVEVPIGQAALVEGNRAKFLSRDVFSAADLLRAMLIFSANDAATALASASATENGQDFPDLMNERATRLGLENSHFSNPTGLDGPGQYSSAADLGKIANAVLDIPVLADIVAKPVTQIRELRTGRIDTIYTTNLLLYKDPRYQGVKTGTTEQAGESLIVRYKDHYSPEKELDLILVLLGSEDRFTDAQQLIQWARINLTLESSSEIR